MSDGEEFNTVHATWGEKKDGREFTNHVDLVGMLDIADLDKGADVAGGEGII